MITTIFYVNGIEIYEMPSDPKTLVFRKGKGEIISLPKEELLAVLQAMEANKTIFKS